MRLGGAVGVEGGVLMRGRGLGSGASLASPLPLANHSISCPLGVGVGAGSIPSTGGSRRGLWEGRGGLKLRVGSDGKAAGGQWQGGRTQECD